MALSGRVTERFGGGLTALIGGAITIVATIPFVLIDGRHRFRADLGAAMVVRGFGIGMSMMPSMTAAFAVLRPDQVNDATPQLNVLQRVGGSIGTAILTVVLAERHQRPGAPRRPRASPARSATPTGGCSASASSRSLPTIVLATIERPRARRSPEPLPAEVALEAVA